MSYSYRDYLEREAAEARVRHAETLLREADIFAEIGTTPQPGWPGDHRCYEAEVIVARDQIVNMFRCVDCGEARTSVFDFTPHCPSPRS